MRKKLIAIGTAAAMAMAPAPVYGEVFTGGDNWSVAFDGEQMTSTFTSTDISDALYSLQPGDTAKIFLALRQEYKEACSWYMTNEVLQSLEDSQQVAEGGAYSYVLTYVDPEGEETLLYSSREVGGETVNQSGEGLHQATDSLEEYFYLDTLEEGEKAGIRLEVLLEGETQGNEYQDTLARLQMNFAVELGGSSETPGDDTPGGSGGGKTTGRVVKTGDTSQVLWFSLLTTGAGLACLVLLAVRLYSERKAGKQETAGKGGERT